MAPLSPAPTTGRVVTAVLLLLGGLLAAVSAVVGGPEQVAAAGFGLLTGAAGSMVLSAGPWRDHAQFRSLVAIALVVVVATQLGSGPATVAIGAPVALAALVVWSGLANGRRHALLLAVPVAVAAAVATIGFGLDALHLVAVVAAPLATVPVMEAIAVPLERSRRHRQLAEQAAADMDTLLVAGIDLRGVDDLADAGDRICRIATDLVSADGAVTYLKGPGRLLLAGRHGTHPAPIDHELGGDNAVSATLRDGAVHTSDLLIVPITGGAGVIGAITLHNPRRSIDDLTTGVLHLFGGQAGALLDRLGAVESLFDAATRDPVTGVGSRRQASAVVASIHPGDGLVLLALDGFAEVRANSGPSADLLLGQFGLHLRDGIRPGDAVARYADDQFVLVLRELKAPVEVVIGRLVDSWLTTQPLRTISVGAALHLEGAAPLDTLDHTQIALDAAQRRGGGGAAVSSYLPIRLSA